jgi:hypothetical protein
MALGCLPNCAAVRCSKGCVVDVGVHRTEQMCLALGKISNDGPERSMRFIRCNIFMDVKN